jgi:dinuclear metal center YbgI/SA1388 family protein
MPTVADLVAHLEALAPAALAADWDNVGLLLGQRALPVQRVMTCLTVTPETVNEACDDDAGLLVSHHPILFRGTKRLTADTAEGGMLLQLAAAGTAVYSPHTAWDNARGGINDLLCRKLGLRSVAPLRRRAGPRQCKVVVFVPENDLGKVSDALFAAGAGHIGQYSECSFRLAGTGTFFGSDASNPTVGQKGRREEVGEWRLEALCPEGKVDTAVAALRRAHSYEEPAYDVYPLRPAPGEGEGRVGDLETETPLGVVARSLKNQLGAGRVDVVGDVGRAVRRVAVVCGAGGDFVGDAGRAGADVLLTGEARFHDQLAAQAAGLSLLLPGHYASERLGSEELARLLQEKWPELHVWASRREADPVAAFVD